MDNGIVGEKMLLVCRGLVLAAAGKLDLSTRGMDFAVQTDR